MFKSEHAADFFSDFKTELLRDSGLFLNRCVHLLRVACKENQDELRPTGWAWVHALYFINHNLAQLSAIRLDICEFLKNFASFKVENPSSQASLAELIHIYLQIDKIETAKKEIICAFIEQIEAEDKFWQAHHMRSHKEILIVFLFGRLVPFAKNEVTALLKRASMRPHSYHLSSFYDAVIGIGIFVGNDLIIKELPELFIEVLWNIWRYEPEEPYINPRVAWFPTPLTDEKRWGLINDCKHGRYGTHMDKTILYKLLKDHPELGLKFFTEFLNYSIDFYVKADFDNKNELELIDVELNNGRIAKLWGSDFLWMTYRGFSYNDTNDIMNDMLKGLERYLLEIAALQTEESRQRLSIVFDELLTTSNNIAPLSVLSSVVMAYPKEVGTNMLPLLRVKSFYDWDCNRHRYEQHLSGVDLRDVNLPHRKAHLKTFIANYQLEIRILNSEIYKLLDKLKEQPNTDIQWKRLIDEIDTRTWKATLSYNKKTKILTLEPDYSPEVKCFFETERKKVEAFNVALTYMVLIEKSYKNAELITLQQWKQIYQHQLNNLNTINSTWNRPFSLAAIGLRDYRNELANDEKAWCINTLLEIISEFVESKHDSYEESINLSENDAILYSFHYLFQEISNIEAENELILLMSYMMFVHGNLQTRKESNEYLKNVFWQKHPKIFKKLWAILIQYGHFNKTNSHYKQHYGRKRLKFLQNIIKQDNINIDFNNINSKNYKVYQLMHAFVLSIYWHDDKDYRIFIEKFMILLKSDLKFEANLPNDTKRRALNYYELNYLQEYLAKLLLNAELNFAQKVLGWLIDPLYEPNFKPKPHPVDNDLLQFAQKVLKNLIYQLAIYVENRANETAMPKQIEHFWILWQYLFDKIKQHSKNYLTDVLLLDIDWKSEAHHWKALEGKKKVYESFVRTYGTVRPKVVFRVFATIGEKTFLPNGIKQLVAILKAVPKECDEILTSDTAKILIQRLFYNHLLAIKTDKQLIDAYIWILDKMIDLDSSEAYFFRENVITYKTNV